MGGVVVGKLTAADVRDLALRLKEFLRPYQEIFWQHPERQEHLDDFVTGLMGGTERKSVEPIALSRGKRRSQLQHFVGVSEWDHRPHIEHLQRGVGEVLGEPEGVLVVDGSGMPKKGTESVGVARQWCGRLGKVDNCQVGIFAAYAGKGSCTLIDERLYLPKKWIKDAERRQKCHVPKSVGFKRPWELADEMLRSAEKRLPHRWIVADSEFGRATAFRDRLAKRGERYIMEVPQTMTVRQLPEDIGRPPQWHKVKSYLARKPIDAWTLLKVRDGEKGPIEVLALAERVKTRRRGGRYREEMLVAIEALGGGDKWYFISNAPTGTPLEELCAVASKRHLIEEAFENAKGEVGLDHHEVRGWQGWHHHMTCGLLALWFLVRERRRLGKKSDADVGAHGPVHDLRALAAAAFTQGDRAPVRIPAAAQRGSEARALQGSSHSSEPQTVA